MARAGEGVDPPLPAPSALRPFLSFAKLPQRALETARRVLEDDEEFRRRVRAATSEDVVGHAGWLFLDRPPGWQEALAAATAVAEREAADRAQARDERSARRRAEYAEEAARRAAAAADEARRDAADARRDADDARRQLAEQRHGRQAAESELGRVRQARSRLEAELEAALARAADAESRAADARRSEAAARAEVERLETDLRQVRDERDRLAAAPSPSAGAAEAGAGDVPGLAASLAAAADALAAAARALAAGATAPAGAPHTRAPASVRAEDGMPPAGAGDDRPVAAEAARRVPVALPPGMRDDAPEAAEAVVRAAGLVLLVDGYNVSLRGWPDRPLTEQRRRLVDGLQALAARCGVEAHVVFDGTDEAARTVADQPRSRVRVTFTAAGVEADDVLVGLVGGLPLRRPAAVASNDRRVRDAAAAKGANLLTSEQLLHLLGR